MHRVVALSLCALACAACAQAREEEEEPAQDPANDVSLLQSAFRIEESAAKRTASGDQTDAPPQEALSLRQGRIDVAVPTLVVDLDQPPERRWANVTNHWLSIGVYPQAIAKRVGYCNALSADTLKLIRNQPMEDEYRREMQGIVSHLGLPADNIDAFLLTSVGYEIKGPQASNTSAPTGCSGLLAAMPNGTVLHGRNMDYFGAEYVVGDHTLHFPELTVEVTFVRGGRPLYMSVQWPLTTGIHTAMRFGGWSFEQNTRFHDYAAAIQHGLTKGSGGFMLGARKVMETTPDFETAVARLQALNLMAPCYFILAGTRAYEGAVITMDDGGGREKWTPLLTRLSSSTATVFRSGAVFVDWNIIQTNDDLNKMPLDWRRPVEELKLAHSTQDMVSPKWVFEQMEADPLYNGNTVFTSVFAPATGFHQTFVHPENGH